MNIGVYGGSFNPIHFGHIGLALWTLEHTPLDQLWLMVTPSNPLKDRTFLSANEQERLLSARQAVQQALEKRKNESEELRSKELLVSDFEFSLPRPSYTAQTLRALQQAYPENEYSLLIGEDNWLRFSQWRDYQWIGSHFPLYVYPRHSTSSSLASNQTVAEKATEGFLKVTFLSDAPYFDISSTQLREEKSRRGEK